MKSSRTILLNVVILVISLGMAGVAWSAPMGTAFTYQGRLTDANSPAEGEYDFEFALFNNNAGGDQYGNTVTKDEVDVIDGYFTVQLDFVNDANVFDGDARWLEIGVRQGPLEDPNLYVSLSPRQEVTPAPYALALPGLWTQQNATSTNLVGGYNGNTVTDGVVGATISGGGAGSGINKVTDVYGTVCGGSDNQAGDDAGSTSDAWYATVGGGESNTASGDSATVGGGYNNTASGWMATVCGGGHNTVSEDWATVGGGYNNTVGRFATVGGGFENTASGMEAAIPGGNSNVAGGYYSFAAGRRAKVRDAAASGDGDGDEGTFVWADSTDADFQSTGPDQFLIRASGGVGIGTTSPATQLDVNGTITATGGDSDNWNTAYGWGDHGGAGYLSSGQSAGGDLGGTYPNPTVIGLTLPISETASSSSELLDIRNTLSSDDTAAIFGMHDVTDWYGFGVVGQGGFVGTAGTVAPIGSGTYYGVWGEVDGGTGTNYGVRGVAVNGTTNYGVYGYAAGGTTNYAGYFSGDVHVTGTLSKAAGSFKIDHPLDPENKYLNHSFVESPDMMNVYNGNVVLDNNGQAVVEMPDWFDALNRDCRYQITCIGGFAPVYIAQKIQNNTFKIAGGTAGLEVSWQVTGIRQDPYAEANRIQVEVDKPADERGKYLHAQAYGLEEGLSVGYENKKHAETKWKKKETSKNY